MKPHVETLTKIFRALSPEQKGNLRWHLDHGTRICCGALADEFVLGGAG